MLFRKNRYQNLDVASGQDAAPLYWYGLLGEAGSGRMHRETHGSPLPPSSTWQTKVFGTVNKEALLVILGKLGHSWNLFRSFAYFVMGCGWYCPCQWWSLYSFWHFKRNLTWPSPCPSPLQHLLYGCPVPCPVWPLQSIWGAEWRAPCSAVEDWMSRQQHSKGWSLRHCFADGCMRV